LNDRSVILMDNKKTKKDLIMSVALEEFAEFGYHATSVHTIAKKANVSKGLLYNYFESKEDLLKEIIFAGLKILSDIFDPDKDGVLTEDEFEFLIEKVFNVLKENLGIWRLYFSLLMKSGVQEIIKEPMYQYMEPFLQILNNYYKRQGKKNPEIWSVFFGSVLDGISVNFISEPELYPLEEIKKLIINVLK